MKYFLVFLFFIQIVHAEKVWISDNLRTSVTEEAGFNKRFIAALSAGDEVERLENSKDGEYVKIKKGEVIGWVAARNLMNTPSIHSQFAKQSALLAELQAKNTQLQISDNSNSQMLVELQQQVARLTASEKKALAELERVQHAAANVVTIDNRNRELEAQLVQAEQTNLSLRHQNDRLGEALLSKQMYIGGLLMFFGFIAHWLLDHFRAVGRRRRDFDML